MSKSKERARIVKLGERIKATSPEIRAKFTEFLSKTITETDDKEIRSFLIEFHLVVKNMK